MMAASGVSADGSPWPSTQPREVAHDGRRGHCESAYVLLRAVVGVVAGAVAATVVPADAVLPCAPKEPTRSVVDPAAGANKNGRMDSPASALVVVGTFKERTSRATGNQK